MARFITVYALNNYEGTVAPADAQPPWSITFRGGKAEVPLLLYNDNRFQSYLQRQVILRRWSMVPPAQDAIVTPAPSELEIIKPVSKPKAKPKASPAKKPAAKKK